MQHVSLRNDQSYNLRCNLVLVSIAYCLSVLLSMWSCSVWWYRIIWSCHPLLPHKRSIMSVRSISQCS